MIFNQTVQLVFFRLYLILNACAARFDVIIWGEIFWKLNQASAHDQQPQPNPKWMSKFSPCNSCHPSHGQSLAKQTLFFTLPCLFHVDETNNMITIHFSGHSTNRNPNSLLLLIAISPWFCFCISIQSQLCQDSKQVVVRVAVTSTPTKLSF